MLLLLSTRRQPDSKVLIMKLLAVPRPSPARDAADAMTEPPTDEAGYEPPLLFDLGHVRELTLGSSSSGSADSNSQYYW
ncbi:hypothetical protein ED92_37780 [Amycolatopsis sp. MJM2582]|nr:hypothetical protein ED92_37780 [Amycolatopsis sp. MJM2582]